MSDPLESIVEVINWSDRLALVLCAGPALREKEGLAAVRGRVPTDRATIVHWLDRDGPDIASTIARASSNRPVVLVGGLEWMDERERADCETRLNLLRDSLARYSAVVVLWIPTHLLQEFQSRCPDLFHWRSLLVTLSARELPLDRRAEELRTYLNGLLQRARKQTESLVQTRHQNTEVEILIPGESAPLSFYRWLTLTKRSLLSGGAHAIETGFALEALASVRRRLRYDAGPIPIGIRLADILRSPEPNGSVIGQVLRAALGRHWSPLRSEEIAGRPHFVFVTGVDSMLGNRLEDAFRLLEALIHEKPNTRIVVADEGGLLNDRPGWKRAALRLSTVPK